MTSIFLSLNFPVRDFARYPKAGSGMASPAAFVLLEKHKYLDPHPFNIQFSILYFGATAKENNTLTRLGPILFIDISLKSNERSQKPVKF